MPLLGLIVIIATVYGLVVDDAYRLISPLTRETWRAQDAVTLTTVPVLLWATWRARAGSLSAHLVSVGILMWLTYGYAHLSIGAPFNAMFLIYLAVLTLAGFAISTASCASTWLQPRQHSPRRPVVPWLGSWRSPVLASRRSG